MYPNNKLTSFQTIIGILIFFCLTWTGTHDAQASRFGCMPPGNHVVNPNYKCTYDAQTGVLCAPSVLDNGTAVSPNDWLISYTTEACELPAGVTKSANFANDGKFSGAVTNFNSGNKSCVVRAIIGKQPGSCNGPSATSGTQTVNFAVTPPKEPGKVSFTFTQ